MKFDFAIGNPPYQEETENNGRQSPVYNKFMDAAFEISDCAELITPARFLFDAGQTPKEWNRRMLSDQHYKVLYYEPDASKVFPNTEIKGGVAISIRDASKDYGKIGIFTKFTELNSILKKTIPLMQGSLADICTGAVPYRFTNQLKSDHPDFASLAGKSFDLRTNCIDNLFNKIFFLDSQNPSASVQIYGVHERSRVCAWVLSKYIDGPENFNKYKLLLSKAVGSGTFGETLPPFIYAHPGQGHTQSFISIGSFDSIVEAENLEKYLKTKFCRCLLGVLKVTQDVTPSKWKYVPLQNFAPTSDIDWSSPISDIDHQLYAKYGLTNSEIEFIESHVRAMI